MADEQIRIRVTESEDADALAACDRLGVGE
jgi:hypothetical protein